MAQLFSQYKQMFDKMTDGAFFQRADGALVDVNPAALELFGLTLDQFMGRTSYHPEWQVIDESGKPLPPEQHPSMVALRTGLQVRNFIAGVQNPLLQNTVWLEINATPLFQEEETAPSEVFVTLHNISARKQTEESLLMSEDKFTRAFNLSPALMSISTLDNGCYLEVNDSFCRISGFDRQDVIGRTSVDLGWIPAAKREELKAILLRDGQISNVELELKRHDGAVITVLYNAVIITIAGQKRLLSIAIDISERKIVEQALKRSEVLYRAIVNTQTEFVDRYLPGGILTFVNEALCQYWKVEPADLIGKSFYPYLHEDDLQTLLAAIHELTPEKTSVDLENRVNFHDGTFHWHSWTHQAIFDQDGNVIEYQSVGRDITRQKQAEIAKKDYEVKLTLALEAAMAGMWDRDLSTGEVTWSRETFSLYGIDHEQGKASLENWQQAIHPDDREQVNLKVKESIRQQHEFNGEYRIILPDGSIRWLKAKGRPTYDAQGRPLRISGITLDITERKKQEKALQNIAQMARAILGSTDDTILYLSHDGTILMANQAMADRFGQTIDTLVGTNVFSYFPDEVRRLRQENLAEAIRTRSPLRSEDMLAGRFYENCLFPVIGEDNSIIGVTVFTRDVTELKQYQADLKKANEQLEIRVAERTASLESANEQIRKISFQLLKTEEQERLRIAAELHDHVGQTLLLAKMKLDELAMEDATAGYSKAANVSAMLETCIQDIRTLTFAMRPPLLDTAGVESALEWLCKSMQEIYRLQVNFSCCCRSIDMISEKRYSLYQAVRELLLNVAKHAGVVAAELSLIQEGADLIVRVSDHGRGFETSANSCRAASGNCFGLYSVQQRVELMGGCCRIDSKPGQGTVVTLTIAMGA